jgi:uncharacterized protein YjbI with pentapeptide repeats
MQSATITPANVASVEWDEQCFRFCEFLGISVDGEVISSEFIGCSFKEIDWYWGLFTQAIFVKCSFENCTFRGTSFPDARFVECKLTGCRFTKDNLDGDCDFRGAVAYACEVNDCQGFAAEIKCQA